MVYVFPNASIWEHVHSLSFIACVCKEIWYTNSRLPTTVQRKCDYALFREQYICRKDKIFVARFALFNLLITHHIPIELNNIKTSAPSNLWLLKPKKSNRSIRSRTLVNQLISMIFMLKPKSYKHKLLDELIV